MRVLIVEDDIKLAEFTRKGLLEAGFEVDHAPTGPDGLSCVLNTFYDAFIFDIMVPGMNGISLIEEVRRRKYSTPILILSAQQSVDSKVKGLQCGGDDYMVKPFSFTELLARLHALIRRAKGYGETTHLSVGSLSLDMMSREVVRDGRHIELQNREFELLQFLMRNKNRVVSRTMIIENVWNFNFDPHTNIVEARMSKLREKVDRGFHHRLIQTVRGAGYVIREGP